MNRRPLLISVCLFTLVAFTPGGTAQSPASKESSEEPSIVYLKPAPTVAEQWAQLPTEIRGEHIFKGKELDKKPVIRIKPEPQYPDEARSQGQQGVVVLRCVFGSSGKITAIYVLFDLPYGLTQAAIAAANQIKFTPAMKGGKAVSTWLELQYNFEL